MTESEFDRLFQQALSTAAENVERRLSQAIPRVFEVAVYGAGYSGKVMSPEQAVHTLYLGPDRFYRIIDVAITAVTRSHCTVFVRVSGHTPGSFEETWNEPPGAGPFKQLLVPEVRVE